MFTLNGGIVSWKSSIQEMTMDSTTKSECIVPSDDSYGSDLDKVVLYEQGVVPSNVNLIL